MHVGTTILITESRGDLIGLRDFVQAAEELGYSHIRILDHGGRLPHAGTSLRRTIVVLRALWTQEVVNFTGDAKGVS